MAEEFVYFVHRRSLEDGREGWTGPVVGLEWASREKEAWESEGRWEATLVPDTERTRQEVKEWEETRKAAGRPPRPTWLKRTKKAAAA
jgi:hypothetical protein